MTSIQFLKLLRAELAECETTDESGSERSAVSAIELIEEFKKNIQNETINDFKNFYKTFAPDKTARDKAARHLSRKYENS